jgi:hypothetical protein
LLALGESGPGYQLISVGPSSDNVHASGETLVPVGDYVVFNAELLIPATLDWDPRSALVVWPGALDYDAYKGAQNPIVATGLGGIPSTTSGSGTPSAPRSTFVVAASTRAGQILWRFSAYNPDKRITAGQVEAGAYLTSELDRVFVNTGLGAVGRFALPNPFPATYAYRVTPSTATGLQAGTVRPAFGQAGGGVEVVLATRAPVTMPPIPLPDL